MKQSMFRSIALMVFSMCLLAQGCATIPVEIAGETKQDGFVKFSSFNPPFQWIRFSVQSEVAGKKSRSGGVNMWFPGQTCTFRVPAGQRRFAVKYAGRTVDMASIAVLPGKTTPVDIHAEQVYNSGSRRGYNVRTIPGEPY